MIVKTIIVIYVSINLLNHFLFFCDLDVFHSGALKKKKKKRGGGCHEVPWWLFVNFNVSPFLFQNLVFNVKRWCVAWRPSTAECCKVASRCGETTTNPFRHTIICQSVAAARSCMSLVWHYIYFLENTRSCLFFCPFRSPEVRSSGYCPCGMFWRPAKVLINYILGIYSLRWWLKQQQLARTKRLAAVNVPRSCLVIVHACRSCIKAVQNWWKEAN